jgi:hypothetical protein
VHAVFTACIVNAPGQHIGRVTVQRIAAIVSVRQNMTYVALKQSYNIRLKLSPRGQEQVVPIQLHGFMFKGRHDEFMVWPEIGGDVRASYGMRETETWSGRSKRRAVQMTCGPLCRHVFSMDFDFVFEISSFLSRHLEPCGFDFYFYFIVNFLLVSVFVLL